MHTPDCRDGISWWPESSPTPIDVSTLSTSGLSNPLRLPGERQWVGVWGDFVGLRIALATAQSFLIPSGGVFPYPTMIDEDGEVVDVDIFLTKDTGGNGTANIGRFHTMEAARAWAGLQMSFRTIGGSAFGPFPAATAMTDSDPNPTTTRVGAMCELWDGSTIWNRWRQFIAADGTNAPAGGAGAVVAFDEIFNDRTSLTDRLRQPDSYILGSSASNNISLASTGVVLGPTTVTQAGMIMGAHLVTKSGTPTNALLALQIIRSAVTYTVGISNGGNGLGAALNVPYGLTNANGGNAAQGNFAPIHLNSSDQFQINVLTAAGAAAAADLFVNFKRERFAF